MIIPLEQLNEDTLNAIITEYILREGTDYGAVDATEANKIAQIKLQLKQGSAVLVYSELHESVNILPKEQFAQESEQE
mgnify:CR=1 FL=1